MPMRRLLRTRAAASRSRRRAKGAGSRRRSDAVERTVDGQGAGRAAQDRGRDRAALRRAASLHEFEPSSGSSARTSTPAPSPSSSLDKIETIRRSVDLIDVRAVRRTEERRVRALFPITRGMRDRPEDRLRSRRCVRRSTLRRYRARERSRAALAQAPASRPEAPPARARSAFMPRGLARPRREPFALDRRWRRLARSNAASELSAQRSRTYGSASASGDSCAARNLSTSSGSVNDETHACDSPRSAQRTRDGGQRRVRDRSLEPRRRARNAKR